MTKSEYVVAMYFCHIHCTPIKEQCENCQYIRFFKQIYSENL